MADKEDPESHLCMLCLADRAQYLKLACGCTNYVHFSCWEGYVKKLDTVKCLICHTMTPKPEKPFATPEKNGCVMCCCCCLIVEFFVQFL